MFSYKDYLYAIAVACEQQADLYGALPRENDYEDGFMSRVHNELSLVDNEIKRFLHIQERSQLSLKTIFDDILQNKKSNPQQKAEDIACLLVQKMDERRKLQPPFSYTQEDHDRNLERLFNDLRGTGFGLLPATETSSASQKDFDAFSRGVNEGADFAFETVLPQIIKDYQDMVTVKISPYWQGWITHATAQKYLM